MQKAMNGLFEHLPPPSCNISTECKAKANSHLHLKPCRGERHAQKLLQRHPDYSPDATVRQSHQYTECTQPTFSAVGKKSHSEDGEDGKIIDGVPVEGEDTDAESQNSSQNNSGTCSDSSESSDDCYETDDDIPDLEEDIQQACLRSHVPNDQTQQLLQVVKSNKQIAKHEDKCYARHVCGGAQLKNLADVWNDRDGRSIEEQEFQNSQLLRAIEFQYLRHSLPAVRSSEPTHAGKMTTPSSSMSTHKGSSTNCMYGIARNNMKRPKIWPQKKPSKKRIPHQNHTLSLKDINHVLHEKERLRKLVKYRKLRAKNVGIINSFAHCELEVYGIIYATIPHVLRRCHMVLSCSEPKYMIHLWRRHPLTQAFFGSLVGAVYMHNAMRKQFSKGKASNLAMDVGIQMKHFICLLKKHAVQITEDLQNSLQTYWQKVQNMHPQYTPKFWQSIMAGTFFAKHFETLNPYTIDYNI